MPTRPPVRDPIAAAAARAGVPEWLFRGVVKKEGGTDRRGNFLTSPAGARGPSQLMPGTAAGLEKKYGIDTGTYQGNLLGGAYYLAEQLSRFKRPDLALSAYNSGPGGSESSGRVEGFAETQDYVKSILSGARANTGSGTSVPPAGAENGFKAPLQGFSDGRRQLAMILAQRNTDAAEGRYQSDPKPLLDLVRQVRASAPGAATPPGPAPTPPAGPGGSPYDLLVRTGVADAVTSSGRPGARTVNGTTSFHAMKDARGRPRAYDLNFNDPDYPKLVAAIKANPSTVDEFIDDRLGWYVDRGKIYKGKLGGHGDHGHVAR